MATVGAEVAFLASETGWSESEIMKLPTARRKSYVKLLAQS